MKNILTAALAALFLFLPSCSTTNDLFIAYTGNGIEVQNMAIVAIPGQEAHTANGVGYNLDTKVAYITYMDGHTSRVKITGAGFGGGTAALILEDGTKIRVNVRTGAVTTEAPLLSTK